MSFLIFFNFNYSLFTELFWFEASLHDFLNFFNFWLLGVFGVIFDFLKFSKMSFLIFFNFNYSLFTELFWFEASLHDFMKLVVHYQLSRLDVASILLCHHKSKTAVARACMHGFGSNFVCKLIGPSRNFFVFLANWIRALLIWFLGGGQFVTQ